LSRREREIMDIIHRLGRASVNDVMSELSGERAYSTVRAQLRVLEDKGHLRHEAEHLRYVYLPAVSPQKVRRSAVKHLLETFFDGSPEKVVEALVGRDGPGVSDEALDRIAELVERARREGRRK
jgi:BlaI family penicillinase repressor